MTTRDDIVAALERAVVQLEVDAHCFESAPLRRATLDDAVLLRALVDAVREGQEAYQRGDGMTMPKAGIASGFHAQPVWIIPEPKVKS